MNDERNRRGAARTAFETRFVVKPAPAVPFRAAADAKFEGLKDQLLQEQLGQAGQPELNTRLRRAANEAAAIAFATQFPLLVFPALFAEKAIRAHVEAARALAIRNRSADLLAA